jgi:hypothetical protein
MEPTRIALGIALAAAVWLAAPARGDTLYAATDGVDGAGCGTLEHPCRSISLAIDHASAGDAVEVGPGRYGDFDGDGLLGLRPGEETFDEGCSCIVRVDKLLAIRSRDGAAATFLVGPGLPEVVQVVAIQEPGSSFGERNRGFTILAGGAVGVFAKATGSAVGGNVVLYASRGVHASGEAVVVSDNRILESEVGIQLEGPRSVAVRNAAIANSGQGFQVSAADCVLVSNAAIGNQAGVIFASTGGAIRSSTIAGNRLFGASVVDAATRVERTSFYGNGAQNEIRNCGLFGAPGMAATDNYWGSALGPGDDPADRVCGEDVVFEPFATKDSALKLKPIR